jgi:glucose/arabinose dehydrogenase
MRLHRIVSCTGLPAFLVLLAILVSCRPAGGYNGIHLDLIKLPAGFKIELYADGIPNARSMVMSPGGILFVGTRKAGNVYAVVDRDGDFRADEVITLFKGMNMPNGVAFRQGSLYVSEVNRILRFDRIENRLNSPPDPVVVNDTFPKDKHHGWKYIAFGPDDRLYVPVGAPCNICEKDDRRYSTIMRMQPDGSQLEIFAHGVRNNEILYRQHVSCAISPPDIHCRTWFLEPERPDRVSFDPGCF